MNPGDLMAWQWETYPANHRQRTNLLIHIVAIPLFLVGNIGVIAALVRLSIPGTAVSLALMIVAIVLQGRGHALEAAPPTPFTGVANVLGRIFLEQWISFPRYVLSGRWHRALRADAASETIEHPS